MVGLDVANPERSDDKELLVRAKAEGRIILTRDKALADACVTKGARCILIKSQSLEGQLKEMADAGIAIELNPQRCTICNCVLEEVKAEKWQCTGCGKLYWHGSHWRNIEEFLDRIRRNRKSEGNQVTDNRIGNENVSKD
jgi:uncharacterized protein with PIN domain